MASAAVVISTLRVIKLKYQQTTYLTLSMLRANSADDKLMIFFLFS